MTDTLAARFSLQVSEVMDPSGSQATTATNQVIRISGEGTATIVIGEGKRITTTIFTSQDTIHDLFFVRWVYLGVRI